MFKPVAVVMFDMLICNGTVVDGSGAAAERCDVAVRGDRIEAVGKLPETEARQVIDAAGLHVCPGFIDMHGHSDFNMLVQPPGRGKILQGVTTEVMGNCGMSAAPLVGAARRQREKTAQTLGIDLAWTHFEEFMQHLEGIKLSFNIFPLIGHGNIRAAVLGYDNRQPSAAEMSAMEELLGRQLAAGARGLSTGLIYTPGMYAGASEIAALARVAASYGGIYTSHMRSEGDRLLEAIEETIDVGRRAGLPVQISHLKTNGKRNWHKIDAIFDLIERARAEGLAVHADRYPYTASSTGLDVMFPGWACEGGNDAELERLQSASVRDRIYAGILEHMTEEELGRDILIARVNKPGNKPLEGLLLGQAAGQRGQSIRDALFSLLLEEELDVDAVFFSMCEENLSAILKKDYVVIGSDASVWDCEGTLGQGKPHPRAFGSFARVLEKYVCRERLLGLEEAVHKMSGLPARLLGLSDRGRLEPGMKADMVLVQLDKMAEKGAYADPHRFPEGIHRVMVNGVWEAVDGRMTGEYAGKVLLK